MWCDAWSEGRRSGAIFLERCKKADLRIYVEAEGYVHTLVIDTYGTKYDREKKCRGVAIKKWEDKPGYTLKVECNGYEENLLIHTKDLKSGRIGWGNDPE
jgi:hypothetical protein